MPETLKIDGKMNVHICCPTHVVEDSVADKILLPAADGNLMILKDRAPLFICVKAGVLWIYNKGMPPVAYYVDDGIAEVRRNICSVVAWAIKADEVNKVEIRQKRLKQEEKLSKTHSDLQKERIKRAVTFLKMLENKPEVLPSPVFE